MHFLLPKHGIILSCFLAVLSCCNNTDLLQLDSVGYLDLLRSVRRDSCSCSPLLWWRPTTTTWRHPPGRCSMWWSVESLWWIKCASLLEELLLNLQDRCSMKLNDWGYLDSPNSLLNMIRWADTWICDMKISILLFSSNELYAQRSASSKMTIDCMIHRPTPQVNHHYQYFYRQ